MRYRLSGCVVWRLVIRCVIACAVQDGRVCNMRMVSRTAQLSDTVRHGRTTARTPPWPCMGGWAAPLSKRAFLLTVAALRPTSRDGGPLARHVCGGWGRVGWQTTSQT